MAVSLCTKPVATIFVTLMLGWLMPLSAALAAPDQDPYAPLAPNAPEIERLVRDARLGKPGAEATLLVWLEEHPHAAAADRILGYGVLCDIFGARGFNAQRVAVCEARVAAGATDRGLALHQAVANVPPVRAIGSARVALTRNQWGGTSVPINVNDVTVPWLVDTGAEVSVLSQSTADRLRPRLLRRSITVGSTTSPVTGELAVLDLLRIGKAAVENVPVLILPDELLGAGAGEAIPAILGLPALNAFRRVAWLDQGSMLALGEEAPQVTNTDYGIFWHENGIGIPFETAAGVMGAHFDSGANITSLREPFLALMSPDELANVKDREFRIAGAGGVVVQRGKEFASVRLEVGGATITLLEVGLESGSDADAPRAGMDVVYPTKLFVLDFEHMTMRAE
jgi:predicted aspartyl protease